ncbi:MAG: hypothetical protein HUK00_06660 [Bacteroidaceae bacterium]|nr:hypothetical protein [Bacteroidaceae bacterium]
MITKRLTLTLAFLLISAWAAAQGIDIYKTDGTIVRIPYAQIDSIKPYKIDEDPEEIVTIIFANLGLGTSTNIEQLELDNGIVITGDKGTGSTAPAYYDSGKDARLYPHNTLTLTAPKAMKKLTLQCTSDGTTKCIAEGKVSTNHGTITINETKLLITISDIASPTVTISNTNSSAGSKAQIRIKSITITF